MNKTLMIKALMVGLPRPSEDNPVMNAYLNAPSEKPDTSCSYCAYLDHDPDGYHFCALHRDKEPSEKGCEDRRTENL